MNKVIIGVLITVDVILCLLCLWAFRTRASVISEKQIDQIRKTEVLEDELMYGLVNNNLKLNNDLSVIDIKGQTFLLKEIIGDSVKLIVRFSESHCEECVRFVVVKLLRFSQEKKWDKNSILFLASYHDSRNLTIFKDRLNISFPLYMSDILSIPAEDTPAPYCFIVDKTMRINHLFFPDKYENDLSNIYLDIIGKRYFEKTKM